MRIKIYDQLWLLIIPVRAGKMYEHRYGYVFGSNPNHRIFFTSNSLGKGNLRVSKKYIFLIGGFLWNIWQVPQVTVRDISFYLTTAILNPEGPKTFLLPAWTRSHANHFKARDTKSVFSNEHGRRVAKINASQFSQGRWQRVTVRRNMLPKNELHNNCDHDS